MHEYELCSGRNHKYLQYIMQYTFKKRKKKELKCQNLVSFFNIYSSAYTSVNPRQNINDP